MTRHLVLRTCFQVVAVAALAIGAMGSTADAARDYFLIFDRGNYVVQPESSFTINVLLREVATDGDIARLAPGGVDGLEATTFEFDFGETGLVSIGENDITVNPDLELLLSPNVFSFSPSVGLVGITGEADPFDFEDGLNGIEISPGVYELDIASFVFTAGADEGVVDLALNPFSDSGDVSPLALFLDEEPFVNLPVAQITVTAVPEPSTLAALGLATCGIAARRRRRGTRPSSPDSPNP